MSICTTPPPLTIQRYADAFDLLKGYSDGRLRLLARAAADRFDDLPGVPTFAANAMDRAIVAVATAALQRALLTPQTMLERNPALAAQPVRCAGIVCERWGQSRE
jgi:hypothetical protein